jgi:hypothetical protein
VKVPILEVAQHELDEAINVYDTESSGLGEVFLAEVVTAIGHIRRHPKAWSTLGGGFRRCRTRRFPYGLIYHATDDQILIVAIANPHRKPTYWRERLKR